MTTIGLMPPKPTGKPKKDAPKKKDRHKPSYQVRIPKNFVGPLERLAILHGDEVPDRVREAVREYLQRHNLWPRTLAEVPPGDEPPCTSSGSNGK